MDIVFKENYFDEKAEASEDGSRLVFTASKSYPVSDSFAKKMQDKGLLVDNDSTNLKRHKRR